MKAKHYHINTDGTLEETRDRYYAHVSATSISEAKTKLLVFARRALDEPPQLRKLGNATQLAYWSLNGVEVRAGYGERVDLCLAGEKTMQAVTPESASFRYYAELSTAENQ